MFLTLTSVPFLMRYLPPPMAASFKHVRLILFFKFKFKLDFLIIIAEVKVRRAKMFEFEFKGLEMNKIEKSRCGGGIKDLMWYSAKLEAVFHGPSGAGKPC